MLFLISPCAFFAPVHDQHVTLDVTQLTVNQPDNGTSMSVHFRLIIPTELFPSAYSSLRVGVVCVCPHFQLCAPDSRLVCWLVSNAAPAYSYATVAVVYTAVIYFS